MHYGDRRWTEIGQLDKRNQVVVCPLASLEQHGHHLPLLTDTYLVTGVAERVHRQLEDRVLLTPTLWLGASDHHLDFPGTLSVPNSLYVELIKSLVRSMLHAGFRRILLLNGHGGNIAPGETAITELGNSWDTCDQAYVALASYWSVAAEAMKPEQHGMDTPRLSHACEYETSMMLHLHRDLVVMDAAQGQPLPATLDTPGARFAGRFHRFTPTGALGRPDLATADKGASLLAAIAHEVTELISQISQWEPSQKLGPRDG